MSIENIDPSADRHDIHSSHIQSYCVDLLRSKLHNDAE